MKGKVTLLFAGLVAGLVCGLFVRSHSEPGLPRLSPLIASSVTPGSWRAGEPAPSGAVITAPVPSVYLNRKRSPEGEAGGEWYKLASLSDTAGASLRTLVLLPKKQNSNAIGYLLTDDGRAVPVFNAEVLRN